MTYCLEHPSRKMLLMPVEPFEPNKSCYVCSESPLILEVNTKTTKLKEVIDKVIKSKLGMNFPSVIIGSTYVFEDGEGLDTDEAANYASNLEKALAELPAPVVNGTQITVDDFQQELKCTIDIKHRDEFDEEKEPDGMVLAGWSGPVDKQITSDGEKRSVPSASSADDVDGSAENISAKPGMKRKLSEILESTGNFDTAQNSTDVGSSSAQIVEDDDDDVLMFDEDPKLGKRKRLQ
uniref:SAE2 n=1 Tax=Arundo donax TaxID=35708 RepID=A0A0A8XP41_ARUDO